MRYWLRYFLGPLYRYLSNDKVSKGVHLRWRWNGVPPYQKRNIRFNGYKIEAVDVPSFLDQYEGIFVQEAYRFESGKQAPLIYDCGANIGMATLYWKQLYPQAQIKAFEADPKIAEVLKSNIDSNALSNVLIETAAVSHHNEGLEFYAEGGQGGSALQKQGESIKVPSVRLKTLLDQEESIDFLKLDIEGAEYEVINDCKDSLTKVKQLFIEYHQFEGQDSRLAAILSILEAAGFHYQLSNALPNAPFLELDNKKSILTVEIFARR